MFMHTQVLYNTDDGPIAGENMLQFRQRATIYSHYSELVSITTCQENDRRARQIQSRTECKHDDDTHILAT